VGQWEIGADPSTCTCLRATNPIPCNDRQLARLMDRSPGVTFVPVHQNYVGGKQMKLKPLGARALVKMVEREEQTASGIVLPDTAREKPQTAEVVAVGASDEVKVSAGTWWSWPSIPGRR
jgi:hypothetical protein